MKIGSIVAVELRNEYPQGTVTRLAVNSNRDVIVEVSVPNYGDFWIAIEKVFEIASTDDEFDSLTESAISARLKQARERSSLETAE